MSKLPGNEHKHLKKQGDVIEATEIGEVRLFYIQRKNYTYTSIYTTLLFATLICQELRKRP